MAEPLQVERGASADCKGASHKLLERNDGFLPVEFATGPFVGATHRLHQPTRRNVLAAQALDRSSMRLLLKSTVIIGLS
jgi:hypothetical protein